MASGVEMETASGELALPALAQPSAQAHTRAPVARATIDGAEVAARGAPASRTRLWVEALVIAWLCWVYDLINNLAPLRLRSALAHGWGVLHLERSLGLDPELTLNRWLTAHHTLGLMLSDYYDNAHFVVTLGLLGWLWYRRADIYRPLRNTLVAINVIGLAVFWLYPTAPPRLLAGSGFDDVVASTHALGGWHTGTLAAAANQFAAMPSLHMAWAVWCSLVMWRLSPRRWVRCAAVIYPCLTCVAVLATGNHYLLDVLAGVATAVLAALLVRALEARWRARVALRALRAPA
jgi:membrane-associated phospholipid phosphatase